MTPIKQLSLRHTCSKMVNRLRRIRRWIKKQQHQVWAGWRYPKADWLFWIRFWGRDHLIVHTKRAAIEFDTSTKIAKDWFYPRYQNGVPHEVGIVNLLEEGLKPNSCFLDIGANIGFYSLLVSTLCPTGSVHAFEIDPELVSEIRRNMALNKANNLSIVHTAVWEADGHVLGFEPHQPENKSTNMVSPNNAGSYSVSSLQIDSYCEQYDLHPDVVKIDIEGAEVRALRGMDKTLEELDTLFLELHPDLIVTFGDTLSEVADILEFYNFTVSIIQGHRSMSRCSDPISVENLTSIKDNCMLLCEKQ